MIPCAFVGEALQAQGASHARIWEEVNGSLQMVSLDAGPEMADASRKIADRADPKPAATQRVI